MLKNLIKSIPGVKRFALLLGFPPNPRRFLLNMLPKYSVGAEIGVYLGDFSYQLFNIVHPTELHLIDPWEHMTSKIYKRARYGGKVKGRQEEMDELHLTVCKRFNKEIQAKQVKIHRGYSSNVLEQFPDEYFDWVYIDGNHLYEYVKKDLELSFRKTKAGGFITGDDYDNGGWWEGGVKKAVDEFAKTERLKLIETRNRQFIFRK